MIIEFFHPCILPTATAQQRRHTKSGKTYMPLKVKMAEAMFMAIFERHAPPEPLHGAVRARLLFTYPHTIKTAKKGFFVYKYTTPDMYNIEKLVWDAGTHCGYWKDDAQVASKNVEKYYGDRPGIYFFATDEIKEGRKTLT